MNLEELVIDKIVFFIYTKQLTFKNLMILPNHVQNKIYVELECHDKICHQTDLQSCLGELLFKICLDCDLEFYKDINYTVITMYFRNHIRCINQDDPLFITCLQLINQYT